MTSAKLYALQTNAIRSFFVSCNIQKGLRILEISLGNKSLNLIFSKGYIIIFCTKYQTMK